MFDSKEKQLFKLWKGLNNRVIPNGQWYPFKHYFSEYAPDTYCDFKESICWSYVRLLASVDSNRQAGLRPKNDRICIPGSRKWFARIIARVYKGIPKLRVSQINGSYHVLKTTLVLRRVQNTCVQRSRQHFETLHLI